MSETMSRANALAERQTRAVPTNPDVLTLAVAAVESVGRSVQWMGWVHSLDVGWAYYPDESYGPRGFAANVRPEMHTMPAWRPAGGVA